MEINCKQDILFLGAGFSAAAGGFLSREFWAGITNHPKFTENLTFKEELEKAIREVSKPKNYDDYEELYKRISAIPSYQHIAKEIINDVFNWHHTNISQNLYVPFNQKPMLNFRLIRAFLKTFTGTQETPGYIFTTNQDLFIEWLCSEKDYKQKENLYGEYSHNQDSLKNIINIPGLQNSYYESKSCNLTSKIEDEIYQNLSNSPHLNYIKLHGSIRIQENEEDVLLFGGSDKDPNQFKFTKTNFEIFKECLKKCERIFFIGFSFYDEGILKLLIKTHTERTDKLKIIIINPSPQYTLIKPGAKRSLIEQGLWSYITNYINCSLQEIFPTPLKTDEIPSFWQNRINAILKNKISPWNY